MSGNKNLKIVVTSDVTGGQKGLTDLGSGADTAATKSEGAGKRISAAFGTVGRQLSQTGMLGPFTSQIDMASQALDQLSVKGQSVGTKLMAGGGAALGVGGGLTAVASGDIEAEQQLKAAIEATGGSYEEYESRISKAADTQVRFGHTDEQTNQALANLTLATGDTGKALDLMGVVTDYAAKKHVGLAEAATTIGKIFNGSTKPLKEFGITVGKNADGTKDYQGAIDQLSQKLTGQAAAAADTWGGKMKAVGAWVDNAVSQLGQKYGPALMGIGAATSAVGGITQGVSGILGRFSGSAQAAQAAAEGLTGATEAESVAMDGAAVSEGLALGPILLIIAAVAVLAAGIFLLVTNWDTVWSAIQTGVAAAVQFVQDHWGLLLGILTGPFGLAVDQIIEHWDAIVDWFGKLPGRIRDAIGNVGSVLYQKGKELAEGLVHGIGDAISEIPVLGPAANFVVNHFPSFDVGGPVPGASGAPMLAVVHGGEFVLSREMLAGAAPVGLGATASRPAGSVSGAEVHYHFHNDGIISSKGEAERWVLDAIESASRRGVRPGPASVAAFAG